ncbi:beta strand repeat-containing protein [Flagellimonas lutaonensis]|uniref:Uncharacterized protein n=1 Tax=Flagellimonas lutaonensis TaxID=516051 RepID=A0A0D5YU44_9FLAO|nr:hypothetical protein [Allomuricauda lutaonensis]AKA35750.1 hypothetical protein VC82_2156 [Allomuricauda lutaonensis]
MRTAYFILTMILATVFSVNAQVKIGDNPQNIDPNSVLELESSSRVLVISRMGDAQMNSLNPLHGAMVYNTDTQCVHYYDGTQWVNLCSEQNTTNVSLTLNDDELVLTDSDGNTVSVTLEGVGVQTFTADPVVNNQATVVITQTGDNFNFEVGSITGENVVDGSINGFLDIQFNSISSDQLAPNSVGQQELQDNTVADAEIDYDQVTLLDFTNDAGFITGAQIVSPEPGNSLTDNNGAFYDDGPLQTDIANNNNLITNHISNDGDLSDQNEIQDASEVEVNPIGNLGSNNVQTALEELQGDVDNLNAGGANTDEQDIFTNGNPGNIGIDNGSIINLNVNDADSNPNNELQTLSLAGNNLSLSNGGGTVPLPSGADGVISNITTAGNNLVVTGANGGFNGNVPLEALVDNAVSNNGFLTAEVDGSVTNEAITNAKLNGNILEITEGGNLLTADLSGLSGGGADGVITGVTLNGTDLIFSGTAPGFNGTVPLGGIDTTLDEIAVDAFVSNNGYLTSELDGDPTNEIEIPPGGSNGQVLATDGLGNYSWATVGGGGVDTNDFVNDGNLTGETLNLIGTGGGAGTTVDLSPFALDTDVAANTALINGHIAADNDTDDTNELQDAVAVPYDPTASGLAATNAQAAIDEIAAAGGANDFINAGNLNVESLELTGTGAAGATVDLSPFALDTDVAANTALINGHIAADNDTDDTNELQDAVAVPYDPTASGLAATNAQAAIDEIAAAGGANDFINAGNLNVESLELTGTGAAGATVDLSPFALDTDVAANTALINGHIAADNDTDDTNELQDAVAVPYDPTASGLAATNAQAAIDEIAAAGGANDFINAGNLNVESLELTGTGAAGATVDLSPFALDTDVAANTALINGHIAADNDTDDTNELQDAVAVPYDPTASGLAATNAQAAIDEIAAAGTGNNLSNTNLAQTETLRTYEVGSGESLVFTGLGNIGFGNGANPPLSKFHFAGEVRVEGINSADGTAANPAFRFVNDTGLDTGIYRPAADEIGFSVGGFEALRIDEPTTGNTNVIINQSLELGGVLLDADGDLGTNGQVLSATATGTTDWITPAGGTSTLNNGQIFIGDNSNNPVGQTIGGDATLANDGTLTIANNAITSAKILDGDVQNVDIATDAVTSANILDASILAADLSDMGATTTGQIIKWDNTAGQWTIGSDNDSGAINEIPGAVLFADPSGNAITSDFNNLFWDTSSQALGIGTNSPNPSYRLDVNGSTFSNTYVAGNGLLGDPAFGFGSSGTGMYRDGNDLAFSVAVSEIMRMTLGGQVGIGLTNPAENLHVAGRVRADGGFVSNITTITVPDYVFQHYFTGFSEIDPNYTFKSLADIENFLKKNHHLPGIKSAAQVKSEGVWNLSESNLQNLEKIEELFLHTIEQEKKIKALQAQNHELNSELKTLKKDMAEIKAMLKAKN